MTDDKKKYTFEDWLNGNISNDQLKPLVVQYITTDEERGLPKEENQKIIAAKKEFFDWAVESTLESRKNYTPKKIEKVKNPERWLELQINEIEDFINSHPKVEKHYLQGDRYLDKQKITAERYKRYKNERIKSATISEKSEHGRDSTMFTMHVYKQYLPYLKEYKESLNNAGSPLDQLTDELRDLIKRKTEGRDEKGSSKYSLDEYQLYLAVHLLNKNRSRKWKAKRTAEYLKGEAQNRMKYLSENTNRLSDWEDWLK